MENDYDILVVDGVSGATRTIIVRASDPALAIYSSCVVLNQIVRVSLIGTTNVMDLRT